MRINYLILAHKSPEQLELLAKTLKSSNSQIYIHIDAHSNLEIFRKNKYLFENCIFIEKNVKIRWGGFSIVQGTLNGLEQIRENWMKDEDYTIIMSGQDFPLLSESVLMNNLKKYPWKSFIEYRIQPNDEWNILNRVIKYHFHDLVIPTRLNNMVEKWVGIFYDIKTLNLRNQISCYILQRIVNLIIPKKKFFIKECQLYRGSQWQIINWKHVHHILNHLKNPKGEKLYNNFKYTAGPDELFFQTLLLNSTHKDDIINEIARYIDWKKGPWLPRILDESDYENIKKSDKRFARKFELPDSQKLINQIISNF